MKHLTDRLMYSACIFIVISILGVTAAAHSETVDQCETLMEQAMDLGVDVPDCEVTPDLFNVAQVIQGLVR